MQVAVLSLVLAKFGAVISADPPAATVLVMIVCPATDGPAVTAIATVNTLVLALLLSRVPVKDHDPSADGLQAYCRHASGAFSEVETSAGSEVSGAGDSVGGDDDGDDACVAAVLPGAAGTEPPLEHPASTRSSTAGSSALCFIVPPDSRHCCHGLQ